MASALYVADKIIERLQAAQYLRIPSLRNYDADYDIVAKEIAKHIDANDNARIAALEAALREIAKLSDAERGGDIYIKMQKVNKHATAALGN